MMSVNLKITRRPEFQEQEQFGNWGQFGIATVVLITSSCCRIIARITELHISNSLCVRICNLIQMIVMMVFSPAQAEIYFDNQTLFEWQSGLFVQMLHNCGKF